MPSVSANIIGGRLKRLRRARGLSVARLAEILEGKAGLDAQALSAIEAGTRRVKDREVLALARALQVTVDELFPRRARKHGE